MGCESEPAERATDSKAVYRGAGRRALFLTAVLGFLIWLTYFSPLKEEIRQANRYLEQLGSAGWKAHTLFTLLVALLVAIGTPRLVLYGAAGFIFGFWWGLLMAEIGTLAGSYALFLFVRWGGRDWVLHRWPALHAWSQRLRIAGVTTVLVMRQIPVAGIFVNIALGLTHIRNRDFLIGTALGLLPEGIPATMIGAGLLHGHPWFAAAVAAVAILLLATVWAISGAYARRRRLQQPLPEGAQLHSEN